MEYTLTRELDLPRERVVELFADVDSFKQWQPGMVSIELQSGERGKAGAVARRVDKMGKREIEMIETLARFDPPEAIDYRYEAKGVWNEVRNRFTSLPDDRTLWELECEFRCKGIVRVMAWLMSGAFKKETAKHMDRFVAWAESKGPES